MEGYDVENTSAIGNGNLNLKPNHEIKNVGLVREPHPKPDVNEIEEEEQRDRWEHLPNHSLYPNLITSLEIDQDWTCYSSPIVHNNHIYVGDENKVFRFNLNGNIVSTYETQGEVVTAPIIVDGTLVVGTLNNSVDVFDLESTDRIWSVDTSGSIFGSPIVMNQKIYVGSVSGEIFCIDSNNQSIIWKTEVNNGIITRPAINEDQLFVGGIGVGNNPMKPDQGGAFSTNKNKLYSINRETGQILWSIELGSPFSSNVDGIQSDPVVRDDTIYLGTVSGSILGLDSQTGEQKWSESVDSPIIGSLALQDNYLVFGSLNGEIYCIDVDNNKLEWQFSTEGRILTTPAIKNSYAGIGSEYDGVYIFNIKNGEVIQKFDVVDQIRSSPAVHNGFIFQNILVQ